MHSVAGQVTELKVHHVWPEGQQAGIEQHAPGQGSSGPFPPPLGLEGRLGHGPGLRSDHHPGRGRRGRHSQSERPTPVGPGVHPSTDVGIEPGAGVEVPVGHTPSLVDLAQYVDVDRPFEEGRNLLGDERFVRETLDHHGNAEGHLTQPCWS